MIKHRFAVAAGTVLIVSITGCQGEAEDKAGGAVKLAAAQVMARVSARVGKADTYRFKMVNEGEIAAVGSEKTKYRTEMDMRVRLKPELAMAGTVTTAGGLSMPGQPNHPIEMVMVGEVMYMKTDVPEIAGGKPWAKISFSGAGAGDFLKKAKDDGPRELASQLTGSKDVREVGRDAVDGVQTTHYAGTVPVGDEDSGQIDLWVGQDELPRKQVSHITMKSLGGAVVTTTSYFSDYGKPVTVTAPPADQVGEFSMPKVPGN